jgi:hypothetical protein
LCLGVGFWSIVHVDRVAQVFLNPVTAEVGILLLDVLNGLIEIEQLPIRPDKFALLGVELHLLHQITESIGVANSSCSSRTLIRRPDRPAGRPVFGRHATVEGLHPDQPGLIGREYLVDRPQRDHREQPRVPILDVLCVRKIYVAMPAERPIQQRCAIFWWQHNFGIRFRQSAFRNSMSPGFLGAQSSLRPAGVEAKLG